MFLKIIAVYFIIISIITTIITFYDKKAAVKRPRRRVREATLLLLAFSGGAFAELVVMKIIRHKTQHKRFMIGLPVIIILQVILIILIYPYIPMML